MGELFETGRLDATFDGRKETYLDLIQAYFAREWPYRGTIHRTDASVIFVEKRGGLYILFKDEKTVQVFATDEGGGKTRLTITSQRPHWTRTFDKFIEEELPVRVREREG